MGKDGRFIMKCSDAVTWHPYVPLNHPEDREKPFLCRLAPVEDGFLAEWFDSTSPDAGHTLHYRAGNGAWNTLALTGSVVTVTGLIPDTEYELFVSADTGRESKKRYLRTGAVPEGAVVINYLHPEDPQYKFSGQYLCSPSLARLPDGRLVAGMDVFGSEGQNLTILFRSEDNGKTWRYLCDVYPFYWATLFVHRGTLYLLGLTTENGNLQISASTDGGEHWRHPAVLLYGADNHCKNGGVHRAPMQVTAFGGRLYTSCEYGSWNPESRHMPGVLSIDENADPMLPENWSCTGFLPYEGKWKEETVTQGDTMEGNLIRLPDGGLYNVLRWKTGEVLALRVHTDDPDRLPDYAGVMKLPVSASMFRIFPYRNGYLLITNHPTGKSAVNAVGAFRNVLSVYYSADFRDWHFVRDIVNREELPDSEVGFQYPCVLLEGDTLYIAVRSAFNQAHSFHDSNYSLFWEIDLTDEEIREIQSVTKKAGDEK